jgi:hypothetical protein
MKLAISDPDHLDHAEPLQKALSTPAMFDALWFIKGSGIWL